jgi:DNA repair exonuclease SbcCD nuclease subunit
LENVEKASQNHKKRVLVVHQGIDLYLPYEYEIKIGDIPKTFNYCAFGHIHERIVDDFGEGKLAYPGSTEVWRSNELEGYKKNGKGFYLVDLDGDQPEIEKINLKLPREFIKENIKYSELQEEITNINNHIKTLDKKPILNLTVHGGNFSRSEVYEKLNKAFSNNCLSVRPKYLPDVLENTPNLTNMPRDALDIKKMIRGSLEEFKNEEVSELAIDLYKEMSEGDNARATDLAKNFYEGLYDN